MGDLNPFYYLIFFPESWIAAAQKTTNHTWNFTAIKFCYFSVVKCCTHWVVHTFTFGCYARSWRHLRSTYSPRWTTQTFGLCFGASKLRKCSLSVERSLRNLTWPRGRSSTWTGRERPLPRNTCTIHDSCVPSKIISCDRPTSHSYAYSVFRRRR